jgi:chemotaxis protein MotB
MPYLSRHRHRSSTINIWPGFVDALSQLVMVIVFVLLVFTAGQFYLTDALSGRDAALKQLTAQLNQLTDVLNLEKAGNADLKLNLSKLNQDLQATEAQRDEARQESGAKSTTIDQLNAQILALRDQLAQIASALDASEAKTKADQLQIADLGQRLNQALATKVEELARYRSEFFGRLRQVLGNRPDIRIVGDRFVFQSEVLFDLGSAQLTPGAQKRLVPVAQALKEISAKIPPDIDWVLRVDGHTDTRPIATSQYPSNWELSSARAQSVVRFLIDQGIPPNRLAAAGFGEYQPIDPGTTEDAYRKNRRIELKLTER